MSETIDRKALDRYVTSSRGAFESALKQLVEIPSVSMDPAHREDMGRCADAAAALIESIGGKATVRKTSGYPVVLGHLKTNTRYRTVTIYNHMDVQPAGGPEWKREPFQMQTEGDRYYARGATDDKGPALTALLAAKYAVDSGVPINIRFLWELEEEIGSPNFAAFLKKEAKSIPTDSVVVSDTIWVSRAKPAVSAGLRGLQGAILRLETGEKDCHSGLTGGAARNPLAELAEIAAKCVDARTGRVKIPGFYDEVRPLTDEERTAWAALPFNDKRFMKDFGVPKLSGESGYTTLERTWARPTFEVNGLLSGFTGEGAKTVLPAIAMAKVSMRLVPDQDPDAIAQRFEAYVRKIAPKTVELKVTRMHGGKPWMTSFDHPFVKAAGRAIEQGFGRAPVFMREGGSIPVVSTFQTELGLPSVLFGVGLPDENAHAPNEHLDLSNFHNGIVASAILYREIAQAHHAD